MPEYGFERNLYDWLVSQERVMALWISELASTPGAEFMVARLELHRRWLADQIAGLAV
ncbi:MAG: hypothetical protein AAGD92_09165 [Pseudomonadota bacterium]